MLLVSFSLCIWAQAEKYLFAFCLAYGQTEIETKQSEYWITTKQTEEKQKTSDEKKAKKFTEDEMKQNDSCHFGSYFKVSSPFSVADTRKKYRKYRFLCRLFS